MEVSPQAHLLCKIVIMEIKYEKKKKDTWPQEKQTIH